jgi:hypothetical protein
MDLIESVINSVGTLDGTPKTTDVAREDGIADGILSKTASVRISEGAAVGTLPTTAMVKRELGAAVKSGGSDRIVSVINSEGTPVGTWFTAIVSEALGTALGTLSRTAWVLASVGTALGAAVGMLLWITAVKEAVGSVETAVGTDLMTSVSNSVGTALGVPATKDATDSLGTDVGDLSWTAWVLKTVGAAVGIPSKIACVTVSVGALDSAGGRDLKAEVISSVGTADGTLVTVDATTSLGKEVGTRSRTDSVLKLVGAGVETFS